MTPQRPSMSTRLTRDPMPGTPLHALTLRNLDTERERLAKLEALDARLPHALLDQRTRVRDLEQRLGLEPSFPAPTALD